MLGFITANRLPLTNLFFIASLKKQNKTKHIFEEELPGCRKIIAQFIWQWKDPLWVFFFFFKATWLLFGNSCWHSISIKLLGRERWAEKHLQAINHSRDSIHTALWKMQPEKSTLCQWARRGRGKKHSLANGSPEGQAATFLAEFTGEYRTPLIPECGVLKLLNHVKASLNFYSITSLFFLILTCHPVCWTVSK